MSNFIALVYATLKQEGIDTSNMDTDEAVAKFKELQKKDGGKEGENEGTPAEQKKVAEITKKSYKIPDYIKDMHKRNFKGYDVEEIDIEDAIEQNGLLKDNSVLNRRYQVWGENYKDYKINLNKLDYEWSNPIRFTLRNDGKLGLEDGAHRLIALKNAGYDKVEALVRKEKGLERNNFIKARDEVLKNENINTQNMTEQEKNREFSKLEKPIKYEAEQNRLKEIGVDNFFKSDIENIVLKRKGVTSDWRETGYLLQDGSQLDLSDKQYGAPAGKRSADHRDIFEPEDFDDNKDNTDAMIEFMGRGNIRVQPEYPAINLQKEPTQEQYTQIANMIRKMNGKGFTVEFDNNKGYSIGQLEYNGNVNPTQVIEDMKYYFKTGKIEQY